MVLEFKKKDEEYFCSREELSYKALTKESNKKLRKNLVKISSNGDELFPKVAITDFETNFFETKFSYNMDYYH